MIRNGLTPPENFMNLEAKDYQDDKARNKHLLQQLRLIPTYGDFIPGVVLTAQPLQITALLKNGQQINIYKRGLKLVQEDFRIEEEGERLMKPGVVMRFVKNRGVWHVTQLPEVESSLVSMDPQTGAIVALVGGFDFYRNKYNHVTQAQRQPGSIFKPFIYSAALEKGLNAATLVNDGYLYITAAELNSSENWEPQNYNEKFSGPVRLREGFS